MGIKTVLFALPIIMTGHALAFEANDVLGSWQHDATMGQEHILIKADGRFYATTYVQNKIYTSRYGTWQLVEDNLTLNQSTTIRRAGNTEYNELAAEKSDTYVITSVTDDRLVTTIEDVFGTEDVEFTHLPQPVSDIPPSPEMLQQAQQALIIEQCSSAFEVFRFPSALPACLLGATYKDADSMLHLAAIYELGLGIRANPSLADFTYRLALAIGVENKGRASDHFPELQAVLSPGEEAEHPYVGIWCGITDTVGDVSMPSTTMFALNADNRFIYTERAIFRGEYSVSDSTIELGGMVGDMEILAFSDNRLTVKNNGMTRSFSRNSCMNPDAFTAALLENAIASNLVDLYNEILDRGHDVNMVNQESAYKNSPLLAAIKYGRVELVSRLLAAGADLNYVNESEKDATTINTSHAKADIAQVLTSYQ